MNIYWAKIDDIRSGLCNQIFVLVSSIIQASIENKNIVVVKGFANDYVHSNNRSPIDQVFDLQHFNKFLRERLNIILIDREQLKIKVKKAIYGNKKFSINVTDRFKDFFFINDMICISKEINLNEHFGDPCPNEHKRMLISYSVNVHGDEYEFNSEFPELRSTSIFIPDYSTMNWRMTKLFWIYNLDRSLFEQLITCFRFNLKFYPNVESYMKNLRIEDHMKINIIHLRLEEDGIKHWSVKNLLSEEEFKSKLEFKYIDLVKEHIKSDDLSIILCSEYDNKVVNYMKKEGYNLHCVRKEYKFRELNAIQDLIIGTYCNHKFIGNFNTRTSQGSSFDYIIWKKLRQSILKIFIDLENISSKEEVFI